jgi:hypothetical protein
MFAYSDPTGTGFLEASGALAHYREFLHAWYVQLARLRDSGFTLLEAFEELEPGTTPSTATVDWIAFPRTAPVGPEDIDRRRFDFQDEYVEWRTERDGDGRVVRITFTTEFSEYFEALAAQGADVLKEEIARLIPGADPTDRELFGPGFDPDGASPFSRAGRFRNFGARGPWNNGERGILCLAQQFNTLGALFNLLGHCGIHRPQLDPSDVCGDVGGFCGANRNSDPRVCLAAQTLVREGRSFSLRNPAGIHVLELQGLWKVDGTPVDINDPESNQGAWVVDRNGRRAVLDVTGRVTMGDDPITSGAQVSARLLVGADVIAAPDDALPAWARAGQEMVRMG